MPEDTGALGTAYVQFSVDLSKIQTSLSDIKRQVTESATYAERSISDAFKRSADSSGISMAGLAAKFTLVQMAIEKTVAVLRKIPDTIKESTLLNARVETLGVVVGVVGTNAAYTKKEMDSYVEGIRKMGITTQESMSGVIRMTQAHIDLANSSKLARLAQDAAVIANTNSSEAFNRLVLGIQRGETEILRTMGINVSFEESYAKIASQLGKSTNALTENEKINARVNIVMEKGKDIAGSYEAAMGTVGKQFLSMPRYIEETKNQLGELFKPAMGVLIQGITSLLKKMSDQMTEYKKSGKWDELTASFKVYAKILIEGISNAIDLFITITKVLVTFKTEIFAVIIAITTCTLALKAFTITLVIEKVLGFASALTIAKSAVIALSVAMEAGASGGIVAALTALVALISGPVLVIGGIIAATVAAIGGLTYAIIKTREAEEQAKDKAEKFKNSLKELSLIDLSEQRFALEEEAKTLENIASTTAGERVREIKKEVQALIDEITRRQPDINRYSKEMAEYLTSIGKEKPAPLFGKSQVVLPQKSNIESLFNLENFIKQGEEAAKLRENMLLLPNEDEIKRREKDTTSALKDALQKMNKENIESNKKKEEEILKQIKDYNELFLKQEDDLGASQLVKAEYIKNKLKDLVKSHFEWEYEFTKKMQDTENSVLELVQTDHQKKMRAFDKEYIETKRALQTQDYERETKDNNNLLGEYGKFWSRKTELIFQGAKSIKQAYEIIRDEEKKRQESMQHTIDMQKVQREQDLKILEFRKERGEVGEKEVINKKYENEQKDLLAQIARAVDEFQGFTKEAVYATEVDKLVGETKNNNVVFRDSVEVFRKAVELLSGKSTGGGKTSSSEEVIKTYGTQLSKYFSGNEALMSRILQAESGGNPNAFNPAGGGKGALGLFQIRGQLHEQALKSAGIIESVQDLYDIEKNFKAAALLFKQSGTSPWNASKSVWGKESVSMVPSTSSKSTVSNFAGSLNYTGEKSSVDELKIEKQTKLNMLLESLYDKLEKSKQLNIEELATNDEKIRQAKQEYEWKKELTDLTIISKEKTMNEWTIAERQLGVYRQQVETYKQRVELAEKDSLTQLAWMEKLDTVTKQVKETELALRELNGTFEEGVSRGLKDYAKSMKTTFEYGKQIVSETSSAIKGSFSSLFSDLGKGELKTFESYFTSFANKITDIWANMLADMLTNWIMNQNAMKSSGSSSGFESILGIFGSLFGSGSSGVASGGSYTPPIAYAANGYDIPSGRNPLVQTHEKEMILPAKYADVIRSMASANTSNGGSTPQISSPKIGVEINMKDNTSNKTKMTETDRKYDAQARKFIINTVLEDYSNGGNTYGLIGRKK